MTKYDIMFEALQERVNSGELTIEEAATLNDIAFERYSDDDTEYEEVSESSEDEGVTYEEYLEAMEEEFFGEGAFKKYRGIVNDAINKTDKSFDLYDAAPEDSKLKEQLFTKYNDDLKKEKKLRDDYSKYINADHRIVTRYDMDTKTQRKQSMDDGLESCIKGKVDRYTPLKHRYGYQILKNHKDNFKKNTQGPSKQVINPENKPGRYIKKQEL